MCEECVQKDFPEEVPICPERPEREWPDTGKDPPKDDPDDDRMDRIRRKG